MSVETKIEFLKNNIGKDLLAADFKLSLLVAAQSSYRHDTVLRPFPPMFINEGLEKDYTSLEKALEKLTSVPEIIGRSPAVDLDDRLVDLLHWNLTSSNSHFRTCPAEKFSEIESLTNHTVAVPAPHYIFEVVYNAASSEKFEALRGDRSLLYAFHGSRLENFHSILHHGLQPHMSKNALFGEGLYLSSELSVSMPYSPTGTGWKHSTLGYRLSCFALCEVIDDPASVKCQIEDNKNGYSRSRARVSGSMGGDVPEKYYVVRNSEMVRLKYILVYADKSKPPSGRSWWVLQHKFAVMVILYVILLVAVGLYNSRSFQLYLRKYLRR